MVACRYLGETPILLMEDRLDSVNAPPAPIPKRTPSLVRNCLGVQHDQEANSAAFG